MKHEDEIEDLFHSEFEEFLVTPPAELKKSIDNKIFNSKKKFGYFIFGSIILFLTVSGLLLFSNADELSNKTVSDNVVYKSEINEIQEVKSLSKYKKGFTSIKTATVKTATVKKTELDNLSNKSDQSTTNSIEKKSVNSDKSVLKVKRRNKVKHLSKRNVKPNIIESNTKNIIESRLLSDNSVNNVTNETKVLTSTEVNNLNKSDSLISKSNNVIDSIVKKNENIVQSQKDSLVEGKINEWDISLKIGTGFADNFFRYNPNFNLTERKTIVASIELKRNLKNNFTIASGFQFENNKNNIKYIYEKADSSFIGFDTTFIPIMDSNNTVIGYSNQLTPKYGTKITEHTSQNIYSLTSLSLPIYIGYSQRLKNNLYVDLSSGIIFSYQQAKLISNNQNIDDPTIRNFGLKVCLRPQIRYQFTNFGISVGSNLGYDMLPTLYWNNFNRKRFYSTLMVGVHFSF